MKEKFDPAAKSQTEERDKLAKLSAEDRQTEINKLSEQAFIKNAPFNIS